MFGLQAPKRISWRASFCGQTGMWTSSRIKPRRLKRVWSSVLDSLDGRLKAKISKAVGSLGAQCNAQRSSNGVRQRYRTLYFAHRLQENESSFGRSSCRLFSLPFHIIHLLSCCEEQRYYLTTEDISSHTGNKSEASRHSHQSLRIITRIGV